MNATDIKCRTNYTTNRAATFGGPEMVRVLRKVEVPNYQRPGSETWLIVRFAEGRSWGAAFVYGLACAAIGLIGFGWLLRVDLPSSPIERAFFSLVR